MAANVFRFRLRRRSLTAVLDHHRSGVAAPLAYPQNPRLFDVSRPIQFISRRCVFTRKDDDDDDDRIRLEDTLFSGCDYNHWLITMVFGNHSELSPEEMVETYVQTAAKVLGSVEEAKKKIYACSTTTYKGFQVEVSEQVSEQFKGLPGVQYVLPDAYVDAINKQYGGDAYLNGTIIPRPLPKPNASLGRWFQGRYEEYATPPSGQHSAQSGSSNNGQGARGQIGRWNNGQGTCGSDEQGAAGDNPYFSQLGQGSSNIRRK